MSSKTELGPGGTQQIFDFSKSNLILMVGESFFEVFDDLVDFSAFDEIEVESYGMLGDEFPDEKNEFFLFE